jgi:hypothetical protein
MKTTSEHFGRADGLPRKEVALGIVLGLLLLVAAAVTLSVADPYLRGPGSHVFSLSALTGRL